MAVCSSCGKELPAGDFPFCPFCTAPLTGQPTANALEERKVVTVLFCDLVGFTAASDQADPEDVVARVRPYHTRLRQEIERYGGTVEKFVGDAVMAVFGAPVAHEDDAERAVRAGLRILEAIEESNEADPGLSLQVRIGINTGEAVVALGARPELGEGFVTGDVVNTASRLQGIAPVNGVAVSERTYRGTARVFEYVQLEPAIVKGKTEPLVLYQPLQARGRLGLEVVRTHATPLVGRELERPLLIGTFERAAQQRSCQLVTVVGEAGVGKSRLCMELLAHIDERPGLVTWRQGRCLPYGEGIAFWALGEIVKAECGILESDSLGEAEAKLESALPLDDRDRVWLKARLAPLVGAAGEPAGQEESFTAWRRFIEGLAARRAAVLVFEDLHWADQALLSFLEHLADWADGVPLLVLCTARPELYEQRPTWAAGLRNATTINLSPLTNEETGRLIGSLLERAVLPPQTQQALLERAGGNPLYAEEFVRLLSDRGGLGRLVEVPESVQALIAARLDTLPAERKSLLQDASVVGKVFWAGAVAEMGDRDPREVELALHELARKELVRPARTSSMEGEAEYGFSHLLIRDVCYQQIPRAARAVRHRAAAAWLERQAEERVEDLADVIAHHYLTALELTHAAGQADQEQELEARAVRYLALAGERALGLDVDRAEQQLSRALALCPSGDPERAPLLVRWARAAQQQNRLREAKAAFEEALAVYREQNEPVAGGRTLTQLANLLQRRLGDPHWQEAIAEALTMLEAQPPGRELVEAYAQLASARSLSSAYAEAIVAAERALQLAAGLGLPEPPRAFGLRGLARCTLGDRHGLDDMRQALRLANEQGRGHEAAVEHNNIAHVLWQYDGPRAALGALREGIEFCKRHGITEFALGMSGGSVSHLAALGETEQALNDAGPIADRLQAAGDVRFTEPPSLQLRLLTQRGEQKDAVNPDELVAAARDSGQPQRCARGFAAAAELLLARDHSEPAHELLVELDRMAGTRSNPVYVSQLPSLVRTGVALDDAALADRLVAGVQLATPIAEHALIACRAQLTEAAGDHAVAAKLYAEAADRWQRFGDVPERAYALLGQGRTLLAAGNGDAQEPLTEARELFTSMGYRRALADIEALAEQAAAAPL